jgi:predicted RNA-binding protein YlqC (UPF0109 family)
VADLVEYIVCGLVVEEDRVSLDVTDDEGSTLIEVSCAEADAGRIIGQGTHDELMRSCELYQRLVTVA